MEFNDFIENKRNNFGNYSEHSFRKDNSYPHNSQNSPHRNDSNFKWLHFMETFRNNKKLKLLVLFAVILIFVIIIVLIMILLPLILKFFIYISQNGLHGLVDYITGLLDKIWKGSAK